MFLVAPFNRKTTCSKCEKPNDALPERYCKACHAENMRKNRKKHSFLTQEQRLKANARSYANVYLRRGKIKRSPCFICGAKAEMHHENYKNPTEVDWLCRAHHLELHGAKERTK